MRSGREEAEVEQRDARARPARHAEDVRLGERVAHERLHRHADHGEPAADERGEERARQPQRPHDHVGHLARRCDGSGRQPVEHGAADVAERHIRTPERDGDGE